MNQIIDKFLTKESSPGLRFCGLWTLVTLIGWGLGMVFSVPLNIILVSIIGPNAPTPWSITVKTLIIIFKGLEGAVTGLGMGLGQWLILRRFFKQASSSWIVATAIALATLAIVRWGIYTMKTRLTE